MPDNIDINARRIISDGSKVNQIGQEAFDKIIEVFNGKFTKAESLSIKNLVYIE